MAVQQIKKLDEYVLYLQQTPTELDALFRDLLIGVTSFFRDAEAFKALAERVIPNLFTGKIAGSAVRVWTPGCFTGEEAYSIAILLQEYMDALKLKFKLQVFATDIDSSAIEQARAGIYPPSIAADIPPERLARFFDQEPGGGVLRISKSIRDMLIFSEQDVISDPPFSKLDLISCRNLLIYMNLDLQKKLIPVFHYALRQGGFLFLGTSETVGEFVDLFATIDSKSKLYQRKDDVHGAHRPPIGGFLPSMTEEGIALRPAVKAPGPSRVPLRELTERALLQQSALAGALINERGDILYLHGRTGKYLEPAPGAAAMKIMNMAREGLRRGLTAALHKAVALKEPVRLQGLRVTTNGEFTTINLTIQPMAADSGAGVAQGLFLVIFEEAPATDRRRKPPLSEDSPESSDKMSTDTNARIAALKQELRVKEEYLLAANEELETSNEELQTSNEEMQFVNEELQSTNEELETSKEELQSLNEELSTVNAELQQRVADLTRVNNDMNNLLVGTGIGTIFVDHQLRIQRFTPAVTEVINLILSDMGRPVGHIVSNLVGYDGLVEDVRAVLDSLVPREIEVQTKADVWYQLRIRPYRTSENVIEGAVITFVDISEVKLAREALRETEVLRRLAVVVRDAHDAITVQDLEGHILAWNPGAERMYGWSEDEALEMNIHDLIPEDLREEALAVARQMSRAEVLKPYRWRRVAKDGRIVDVWLTVTALINKAGHVYAIASTERECNSENHAGSSGTWPKFVI